MFINWIGFSKRFSLNIMVFVFVFCFGFLCLFDFFRIFRKDIVHIRYLYLRQVLNRSWLLRMLRKHCSISLKHSMSVIVNVYKMCHNYSICTIVCIIIKWCVFIENNICRNLSHYFNLVPKGFIGGTLSSLMYQWGSF